MGNKLSRSVPKDTAHQENPPSDLSATTTKQCIASARDRSSIVGSPPAMNQISESKSVHAMTKISHMPSKKLIKRRSCPLLDTEPEPPLFPAHSSPRKTSLAISSTEPRRDTIVSSEKQTPALESERMQARADDLAQSLVQAHAQAERLCDQLKALNSANLRIRMRALHFKRMQCLHADVGRGKSPSTSHLDPWEFFSMLPTPAQRNLEGYLRAADPSIDRDTALDILLNVIDRQLSEDEAVFILTSPPHALQQYTQRRRNAFGQGSATLTTSNKVSLNKVVEEKQHSLAIRRTGIEAEDGRRNGKVFGYNKGEVTAGPSTMAVQPIHSPTDSDETSNFQDWMPWLDDPATAEQVVRGEDVWASLGNGDQQLSPKVGGKPSLSKRQSSSHNGSVLSLDFWRNRGIELKPNPDEDINTQLELPTHGRVSLYSEHQRMIRQDATQQFERELGERNQQFVSDVNMALEAYLRHKEAAHSALGVARSPGQNAIADSQYKDAFQMFDRNLTGASGVTSDVANKVAVYQQAAHPTRGALNLLKQDVVDNEDAVPEVDADLPSIHQQRISRKTGKLPMCQPEPTSLDTPSTSQAQVIAAIKQYVDVVQKCERKPLWNNNIVRKQHRLGLDSKNPVERFPTLDTDDEATKEFQRFLYQKRPAVPGVPSIQDDTVSTLSGYLQAEEQAAGSNGWATQICYVCDEELDPLDFPIDAPTSACQHPAITCTDCLHQWVGAQLDTNGFQSIKCPDCKGLLSWTDMRRAATPAVFSRYDTFSLNDALSNLAEFAWCLSPDCNAGQLNHDTDSFMECVACHYQQCMSCKSGWHAEESCRAHQARHAATLDAKTQAYINKHTKLCPGPGCGIAIQKKGGCDHMHCHRCNHEFCWQCMAPYTAIRANANEAHRPECPYFSAGRYYGH